MQGTWDEALLSVTTEDGVREEGWRAEMVEVIQLLKQMCEKETSTLGVQLQELAQMSAGWKKAAHQ